jgi:hypothetical protein
MNLNKKILAAAIVGGLFTTAAQAQVNISAATPTPVRYAEEIVSSTASPVTLAAITANQIQTALLYNFSPGEVRHARIECSPHIRIMAGSVVTSSNTFTTVGAINGLGTNAIHFSLTAGANPNQAVSTDTLTITGGRSITSTAAGTCSYSLYDTPSQAAAGGATGRIVTTGDRPYLAVGRSFRLLVTAPRTSTADVEASPAFGDFVADAPTTTSTAALATVQFDVQPAADQPRLPSGVLVASSTELANILGATTAIRVNASNDGFSAAANATTPFYTGVALNRVYISSSNTACTLGTAATNLSATQANFNVGATPIGPFLLCMERLAGNTIPVSDFTTGLNAVAASAAFAPVSIAAVASGNIVRNGTSLQAPLVQTPTGFISRIVLTNTGTIARPATWNFRPATGGSASEANTTYTGATTGTLNVPANGSVVVSLVDVLGTAATTFGGTPPRGVFTVNVAGPNSQIQGLYQIVNPANGAISNHVMVRPGSN